MTSVVFGLVAHLVGIAQQDAYQALVTRFERDDVLAVGQPTRASATLSSERMVSRITA